ncbi:hypothetical protein INR49_026475 [Caranx melampygus]|nr:hypothetical protein INR49_026475 [Caranx melampygus]
MAKGKGKINSSDDSAPPQPRSLRSRKRECPSEEIQATLHQQGMDNMKENNTAVVGTLQQDPQIPLQDCAMITDQQDQAERPDDPEEVRHAGETKVHLTDMTNKTFEGQEETAAVTSSSHDAKLEEFRVQTDNDTKNSRMEEITLQERIGSLSGTCTNQLRVFLPTSEEGDGFCALTLEKEQGAKDNSQCNLERNHETSQENQSNQTLCMADVKENTKEAEAGLPAKKKRRMGMCGLTETERSNFLQTQRRENGQSRVERVEKQIYSGNTADLVAQEEMMSSHLCPSSPQSIPVEWITEQSEAEAKIHLSLCAVENRAENEVHHTVPTSDVCDPGCLEGKSCETGGGTEDVQEQTGEPAEDEVEKHSDNKEQQELVGSTSENVPKIPVKQRKTEMIGQQQ